jgi:hypothetical protein
MASNIFKVNGTPVQIPSGFDANGFGTGTFRFGTGGINGIFTHISGTHIPALNTLLVEHTGAGDIAVNKMAYFAWDMQKMVKGGIVQNIVNNGVVYYNVSDAIPKTWDYYFTKVKIGMFMPASNTGVAGSWERDTTMNADKLRSILNITSTENMGMKFYLKIQKKFANDLPDGPATYHPITGLDQASIKKDVVTRSNYIPIVGDNPLTYSIAADTREEDYWYLEGTITVPGYTLYSVMNGYGEGQKLEISLVTKVGLSTTYYNVQGISLNNSTTPTYVIAKSYNTNLVNIANSDTTNNPDEYTDNYGFVGSYDDNEVLDSSIQITITDA